MASGTASRGGDGESERSGGGLGRLARRLFSGGPEQGGPETVAAARVDGEAATSPQNRIETRPELGAVLADLRVWAAEISDEAFQPEELDADAGIFDEGYVDSMSYVTLLARVEERYGVAVPDEVVAGSSLSDLARYVREEYRS